MVNKLPIPMRKKCLDVSFAVLTKVPEVNRVLSIYSLKV